MASVFTTIFNAIRLAITKWFLNLASIFGFQQSIESIINLNTKPVKNREIERILREFPNDRISELDWDTGDETEAAEEILNESIRDSEKRYDLSKNMARSMRQIRGYKKLCAKVETRRLEAYNPLDDEHEIGLRKLWALLKPDEKLQARKTQQWQDIGFQGDDPATDFRGMGVLGLDQLVFFAQFDVDNCNHVFKLSQHPKYGFPFAICGIAMTATTKELLFDNMLKNHFYNAFRESPTIDSFHQVYCRVFKLFADFWEMSRPESVMEFSLIRNDFEMMLEKYLDREDANLIDVTLPRMIEETL